MRRAIACAVLLLAAHAHADAPRASAVELFAHGRALAAEGKCAEAIPFFLDTLKLEASVGALLNLAECHEKMHDDARAYARFREAEALAHEKNDDREALARSRAAALAELLPKLAIEAPEGVHLTIDARDARTGENVVSEGDHVVRATAPNKTAWQTTVHASGTRAEPVVVPQLAEIVTPPPPKPRDGTAQRTAGIVVTLTGLATVAAGGLLGGLAIAKKSDEVALSTGSSQAAFEDARAAAKTFADASTATFIIGGVLAAAGLVVWLTAPRAPASISASGLVLTF